MTYRRYILHSQREKCPYSEFFWSVFSRIRTDYGEIQYLSVFTPNAGKYGPEKPRIRLHFSRSEYIQDSNLIIVIRQAIQ